MSVFLKNSGQFHKTTIKLKSLPNLFPSIIPHILNMKGLSFSVYYDIQLSCW